MLLLCFSGLATGLAIIWVYFLMKVTKDDWRTAVYNKIVRNIETIEDYRIKAARNEEIVSKYTGVMRNLVKLIYGDEYIKKIAKLEQETAALQNGNVKSVGLIDMPGYAIINTFPRICQSLLFKKYLQNYTELSGKKHAIYRTRELFARCFSYPMIGGAAVLLIGAIVAAVMGTFKGLFFSAVLLVMVFVLTYGQFDDVTSKLGKRRNAIEKQFPNVVSKLALLVTSGMILSKAWKETAYSQSSVLYMEMRKTSKELDNLIAPDAAYSGFLNRCNTKQTTKLASTIIQSLSKGNAEVGKVLKEMSSEAWAERQQLAKRDGAKATSKLMIPTMMLFISILIMIVVPVLTNMRG